MSERVTIPVEVPAEVSDWLGRMGDEHFRSKRAEAAYTLTEAYKAAGGKVSPATAIQDDLANA